ncbi:anaerobic ribonucleoside-triphosphate reductase [Sporohalobacter salinus]|uniref:anaerobic ribonucleoside-triphosphate reductase n=1 Tax=Sporohalobacter salinus TaxID=1494606 RepID=UPI00195F3AFE|nr:anaerobic ribonucleoside-triphosphate reductase [Sporohalobacter salinus]MBM7624400.1 ribonucleoside-triphosphate reductase [Sporohalobacter salinus]
MTVKNQDEAQGRTKCEVYSRVVGFLTPVSHWNPGKKEEFKARKTYDKALNLE